MIRRTLAFVALLIGCAPAFAATYGPTGWTQETALAACRAQESSAGQTCTGTHFDNGSRYYQLIFNAGGYNVYRFEGGISCALPNTVVGGVCVPPEAPAPTEEECLARNIPDEGDTDGRGASNAFFIQGTSPTSQCISGCSITIDTAFRSFSGVNPATGAPVVWSEHERSWSGETCDTNTPVDQDGNPENSIENPASNNDGEWSCNFDAGTCADPDGNLNVCTFTGSGTTADPYVRSTCVPIAGDADSDGIPNDQDPQPNDPTNGDDSGLGDGTDNHATGGASCSQTPDCQGDGILCNSLFQQWKARCEMEFLNQQVLDISKAITAKDLARTATGANLSCATAPTCSGDAIDCATYFEQRKARCAAEAAAAGEGGDGSGAAQPDWTKVPSPVDPAEGEQPGDAPGVTEVGPGSLNGDGFLTFRSIPTLPDVDMSFFQMSGGWIGADAGDMWENTVLLLRSLVLLLAGIACAFIFAGARY